MEHIPQPGLIELQTGAKSRIPSTCDLADSSAIYVPDDTSTTNRVLYILRQFFFKLLEIVDFVSEQCKLLALFDNVVILHKDSINRERVGKKS